MYHFQFLILGMPCRFAIDCRFYSRRLWTSTECVYCVMIVLISLNAFLIIVTGSFTLVSRIFIDGMCVVAHAPATKTMIGAMVHLFVVMLLMSG